MRTAHAALIFAAAALPATAFAQSSAPTPQDTTSIIVKGQKEKKVCKTFEAPTGSRVGERRICRPQSEWKLAEDAGFDYHFAKPIEFSIIQKLLHTFGEKALA